MSKTLDFDSVFEHKIGDILVDNAQTFGSPEDVIVRRADRLEVLERLATECHGGQQRFYTCRVVGGPDSYGSRNIGLEYVRFAETEVRPFPLAPATEALARTKE